MTPSILREMQFLPISPPEAWRFFSDPRNLPRITPPSLGLEVTSDLPGKMYPGMIITYRIRPIPWVSVGWVTEITHVQEPSLFVDEQRFGPYRFWHHEHRFREVGGGMSKWRTSSTTPFRSARSGGCSAIHWSGADSRRSLPSGVDTSPGNSPTEYARRFVR